MRAFPFPGCCGYTVIAELNDMTAESLSQTLKTMPRGMAVATVNRNQDYARKMLEAEGFKVTQEFRNPNSGNTVTMLTKFQPKNT